VRPEGIRVVNLECRGDLDLAFAWRLRELLKRERPDLVHCHSRRGADVWGGLAASLAGSPAIVSRRVDHAESGLLARWRYRGYERIVAISSNVAAVLRESGVDPERIAVIRSAVDFERFQMPADRARLEREFGIPDNALAIVAAGQLIPRKGYRYLLEAMPALAAQMPRVHLVIFGHGKLEQDLRAQASRLDLGQRVRFAGFRNDLDEYLGAFDLLVHPALREGLGVIMLKAAAAGVPVIAFDVAGAREAVVVGETGLLVTPKDASALTDAMLRLAGSATLRKGYGAAGRKRMRREFSIDAMVNRHIRLYDSVLHGAD
ncbi:MAG TPA: glycosyltransferase, partial [Woeseiaceae bacterium]|nr:glycosyltransferase [Woeseiaceae bacterium]